MELPLPIPNRVVKRCTADDTRKGTVGSCHLISTYHSQKPLPPQGFLYLTFIYLYSIIVFEFLCLTLLWQVWREPWKFIFRSVVSPSASFSAVQQRSVYCSCSRSKKTDPALFTQRISFPERQNRSGTN